MTSIYSTFRVGRYRCAIRIPIRQPAGPGIAINTEWDSLLPPRLSNKEIAEYIYAAEMP